jgi:dienelactone hydrolase
MLYHILWIENGGDPNQNPLQTEGAFMQMPQGSFIVPLILAALAARACGEIRTQVIEYRDGAAVLEGFMAYDDATEEIRPAVLIAPEWWGLTDYPKHRAEQLARMGYVAFAIDMFGNGKITDDPSEAGKWTGPFYSDRKFCRQRAQAGLDTLLAQKYVDKSRVAAIGYCFGGMVALELARSGAPLAGVITFHGDVRRADDEGPDDIKAKILVCHGGDDPLVPAKALQDFQDEMKEAKADYQINLYSGAKHAFTNPAADSHHIDGIAYNEQADKRSWMALNDFFSEIFKPGN